MKKKLLRVLYIVFAKRLPVSYHCNFAKKIRCFFAKRIIKRCGENVNIEHGAVFSDLIEIGDNSGIGVNCEINGSVKIGKNVMMGPEVVIYTSNHSFKDINIPMNEQGYSLENPVEIEDDVWIGRRVIILDGVKIGKGSIIGAGSIVTKSIEPYSIVGGNPAKVIKSRCCY